MADKEDVDVLSSDDNLDSDAMPKAQRLSGLPNLLIFGSLIAVALFVFYGLATMDDSSEKKNDPFVDNEQLTDNTRQKSNIDFLNGQTTGNLKFETINKKDPNDKDSAQLVEGPVIHGKGSNDSRIADMEKKYQDLEMKYNQMLLNKGGENAPQSKEEAENARTILELKREIAGMKKRAFFGALQNPSKTDFRTERVITKSSPTNTVSNSPVSKSTSTNSAEMSKIIEQRRREALSAMNAVDNTGTAIGGFNTSSTGSRGGLTSSNAYYNTGVNSNNSGATEYSRGYNGETLASYNNLNKTDSWVNSGKLEAPVNDFIVRAGFVIPATMISGITSDTPGQIMAQVNQSVFDTATGHHLLIPQGSRLVGTYSAGAVFGQERIMIAWQRIIFPDNKALDLNTMPGADTGGYSGFTDGVDNHWWKLISSAFLMSGITAAVTISTDKGNNNSSNNNSSNNNSSTNDVLRSSMATQFGSVVAKVIQRNLNVAPTLTIRPGYNFNVMVTKDLIFNGPYKSFDYK